MVVPQRARGPGDTSCLPASAPSATVTIALAGRLTPESARLIGEVLRLMCLS